MTRAQVRGVVLTLAAVLAAAGVLLGAPLGLAAGRVLWREVAENTPVQYLPPTAVVAPALATPLSLALAWLLAALPSHRAATMDLGRPSGRSRQAPEAAACAARSNGQDRSRTRGVAFAGASRGRRR